MVLVNPYGRAKKSKTYHFLVLVGVAAVMYLFSLLRKISSVGGLNLHYSLTTENSKSGPRAQCPSLMQGPGVPTFKSRNDLGKIMQDEGFHIGVELGVQHGGYAHGMLSTWPNCSEYHLVDLWAHQENYVDYANVDQERQDQIFEGAMNKLAAFKDKIHVCRNYTTVCVDKFDEEYFDFIYVDARHDFKGVWDDLVAYWPKLKVGGIMAGVSLFLQKPFTILFVSDYQVVFFPIWQHDYVTNDDGPLPRQDW
jgi:hypothetical protein